VVIFSDTASEVVEDRGIGSVEMEFSARMEEELKCPACRRLYVRPVQLPGCWHSLCFDCATARLQTVSAGSVSSPSASSLSSLVSACRRASSTCGGRDDAASVTTDSSSEHDSSDGLSVVSESDSGVVSGSGRPLSCLGSTTAVVDQAGPSTQTIIGCPSCSRVVVVDGGLASLPPTRALDSIVDRYREARGLPLDCQIHPPAAATAGASTSSAESDTSSRATRLCVDCELYVCDSCVHPDAEDAADHQLTSLVDGRQAMQVRRRESDARCADHHNESRSLYCLVCRATVCCVCTRDGRHVGHHTQPMSAMCKAQKVRYMLSIRQISLSRGGKKTKTPEVSWYRSVLGPKCLDTGQSPIANWHIFRAFCPVILFIYLFIYHTVKKVKKSKIQQGGGIIDQRRAA